jgi:hypothetical protein
MKKQLVFVIAAFLFLGCTKVTMNQLYNESTAEKDVASLVKQGLITEEEISLIHDYASSWGISTEDSISYESLLTSAKYEKEKEERNKIMQEKLDQSLSVVFVKKYNKYYRDENLIVLDTKVTNNTKDNICGYKFHAEIKNGSGVKLYGATWTGTDAIKSNSTIITKVAIPYVYEDENIDDIKKIEAADLEKLQVEYHIKAILYADGTSLEIEE